MRIEEQIELSDLNYAESQREMTRRCGGVVHDEGGVTLFAGAHPLPVLMNGAVRTDPRVAPSEVLERAREFFARSSRGFSVIIRGHSDADLMDACTGSGLVEFGTPPAMVLERRLADAASPRGIELHRVASAADAADFAAVMEAAYASLGMPPGVAPAQFARLESLLAPHIAAYLARIDGSAAAGAMMILTHGVAGIYWVGTTPEARGRGLAELCTRAAGNAGFDLGARIASLQASQMGEPVYRRMGYAEITRYPTLVQFEPPALRA